MGDRQPLLRAIAARLPDPPRLPLLWLGAPGLARELGQQLDAPVVVVDDTTRPRRLARQASGAPGALQVVRARPDALPLEGRGIAALVAVDVAGRVPDLVAALGAWSALLVADGPLLLVQRGGLGAVLRRLAGRSARRLAPERLTCALLNAGLAEIGQCWPTSRNGPLVSWGRNRLLPGP